MNLKTMILAGLTLATFSSQAALITPIYRYLHNSGKVVELQGINQSQGTAYYYDYVQSKKVQVNLSDVSKETKKTINGVKAGSMVFGYTDQGAQICTTYNVFENGKAYIGCRTGEFQETIGPARYQVGGYIADTTQLEAAVKTADGFSEGEVARLNGKKVKIKAIFENGYALVESASVLSKLDTSSILLKTSVSIVTTKDLQ